MTLQPHTQLVPELWRLIASLVIAFDCTCPIPKNTREDAAPCAIECQSVDYSRFRLVSRMLNEAMTPFVFDELEVGSVDASTDKHALEALEFFSEHIASKYQRYINALTICLPIDTSLSNKKCIKLLANSISTLEHVKYLTVKFGISEDPKAKVDRQGANPLCKYSTWSSIIRQLDRWSNVERITFAFGDVEEKHLDLFLEGSEVITCWPALQHMELDAVHIRDRTAGASRQTAIQFHESAQINSITIGCNDPLFIGATYFLFTGTFSLALPLTLRKLSLFKIRAEIDDFYEMLSLLKNSLNQLGLYSCRFGARKDAHLSKVDLPQPSILVLFDIIIRVRPDDLDDIDDNIGQEDDEGMPEDEEAELVVEGGEDSAPAGPTSGSGDPIVDEEEWEDEDDSEEDPEDAAMASMFPSISTEQQFEFVAQFSSKVTNFLLLGSPYDQSIHDTMKLLSNMPNVTTLCGSDSFFEECPPEIRRYERQTFEEFKQCW